MYIQQGVYHVSGRYSDTIRRTKEPTHCVFCGINLFVSLISGRCHPKKSPVVKLVTDSLQIGETQCWRHKVFNCMFINLLPILN